MTALACVDGQIMPIEEARVPVEDRGYQFGDAVYEFIATYNGQLFALPEHMERLANSMAGLSFPAVDLQAVARMVEDTFRQSGIARAGIYIQISRGVAARNHAFPLEAAPKVVVTVRPAPEIPQDLRESGISIITFQDIRWGRCDIKTVQLLPNTLAKQKALDSGANDAVFVSVEGVVREGTSSNLFMVEQGRLLTHPLTHQILPGITRNVILAICRQEHLEVQETFFKQERLMAADEVFLTGTVTEVLPVVRVDGQVIGNGQPGALTRRLYGLLRARAGADVG